MFCFIKLESFIDHQSSSNQNQLESIILIGLFQTDTFTSSWHTEFECIMDLPIDYSGYLKKKGHVNPAWKSIYWSIIKLIIRAMVWIIRN